MKEMNPEDKVSRELRETADRCIYYQDRSGHKANFHTLV